MGNNNIKLLISRKAISRLTTHLRTGARVSSPSSGVRPGARALNLELPTSFGSAGPSLFAKPTPKIFHYSKPLVFAKSMFAILAVAFLAMLGLNNSAYAASYLNVSSGGAVSLGSIRPTSSGTSSTGSDTLTVHTDCSAGYSVYVSGQNGKDTDLTNSSAESNNTISTSSNAIGSAGSLSSNTWGLNSENTGTYVGLPTYANATNKALTTKTSVSESSTVPIYYGIKVDTSITPGTYTGDVLYTVLPNSACTTYTVRFNANGGSGTMNNQTINVGSSTALSANTFTKSGYAFLGWSKDKNASIATYGDKEAVKDIADFNTTVDLYAIWAPISGNMQDWTGCPSLVASQQIYLQDARDNKVYSVKKLPDGKCWMTQNLTIGMNAIETGLTLTSADTNIDNGTTYYLPPAGKQGSITSSATLTSTTAANFVNDSITDQNAKTQFRTKGSGYSTTAKGYANDSDTGYYNFYTATLGYSYYNDGKTSGSSTRDICPKGWRLPWTSDSGTTRQGRAEFYALALTYNSDSSVWNNYIAPTSTGTSGPSSKNDDVWTSMSTGAATSGNNYAGFPYAGYWSVTSTSASYLGGFGRYWSSSVFRTNESYGLGLDLSAVVPQDYVNKYLGAAVRCVAQDNYTVNYSADGAESGSPSKTSEGTVYESGSVTMPTVGSMVKSGYEFKGWALTSGASEAAYAAEETVALSALLTAASAAGQTTTVGSTITLYPVWEQTISDYMQGWGYNECSELSTNQIVTLRDSRDDNDYVVKKLADGRCWMVQNLKLVGSRKLTSADSDVTSDFTLTASTATPSTSTWCTTDSSACDDKSLVYYNSSEASSSSKSSYYGALYNWYAATAGTGKYATSSGNATSSICPKGWRLPTGGTSGEFVVLDKAWGGTGENRTSANTYSTFTGAYTSGSNGGFGLAGYISGSVSSVGSYGSYWSSTALSSNRAYNLSLSSGNTDVYPQGNYYKYYGRSVRCVARDTRTLSDITYMQDVNSEIVANTTTNAHARLTDSRDNSKYYVKKLADGKLWMVQNLKLTNYKLTFADSDVTSDFDLTTGITYSGSSGWCMTDSTTCDDVKAVYYNSSEASSGSQSSYYGALYNWYTATAGTGTYSTSSGAATSSICPKGWRLPTGGASGEFVVLDKAWGGTGSNRDNANTYSTFTDAYTSGNNGGFGLAGYILGSVSSVGSFGLYWSSTADSSSSAYDLNLYSGITRVYPQSGSNKYRGSSVRCVAN